MASDLPSRQEVLEAEDWLRSGAPAVLTQMGIAPEAAVRTLVRLINALPSRIPEYRWPPASPAPETRTAATCDRCGGSGPFWIHRDTCVRLCLACTKESDRARMDSHSADSDGGPGPCRDPQCDCMTWVAPETRTTEWAGTDKDGGQP